jgi:hypothetical protein
MNVVTNYRYTTKAKVVNKNLSSYGKEVRIIRKVNRWNYLVEFSPGGRSFYMNVDSLEII